MPSAPSSADEMEAHLNELGKKFDRLKVLYEQYFMGIEKMEPLTARKEITRAIMALQQTYLRNTGLRFKASSLIQKWNIYQSYWNRTMRDIEAGRYVRHVATARRRAAQRGVEFPAEAMGLHLPERPPEATGPHVSDLPFRLPDEGPVPLAEVLPAGDAATTPPPAPTAHVELPELPDLSDLEAALARLDPESFRASAPGQAPRPAPGGDMAQAPRPAPDGDMAQAPRPAPAARSQRLPPPIPPAARSGRSVGLQAPAGSPAAPASATPEARAASASPGPAAAPAGPDGAAGARSERSQPEAPPVPPVPSAQSERLERSAPVPSGRSERSAPVPSAQSERLERSAPVPSGRSERSAPVPSAQSARAPSPQTPRSDQSSRLGSPQTPRSDQSSRAAPEPPMRPAVPGLSEPELRALHERIVTAQQQAGERSRMRYEVLVSQLARQVPKLLQEYHCDAVTFDVITKDGKVRLKPRPGR